MLLAAYVRSYARSRTYPYARRTTCRTPDATPPDVPPLLFWRFCLPAMLSLSGSRSQILNINT
eukprot:scaffold13253_cov140-Isochrysis_galbana.AAC.10